jgi:nitrate/TMAO reductase-like tetraheme cytochrome c subunit
LESVIFTAAAIALTALTGLSHAQIWGGKADLADETPAEEAPIHADVMMFPSGLPITIGDVPDGLANVTAQGCNACHYQAHDDWKDSAHAGAGQSKAFNSALKRAAYSTACVQCHRPLAVQHPTLAAGYIDGDLTRPNLQDNPAFDATLMAEGVGCAACHIRDGQVVSTRAIDNAPHPVVRSSELGTSAFCATCHQLSFPESDMAWYDTHGEWLSTPYSAAGVRCQDCHMPPKPGVATATRFAATPDHGVKADLARALTALVNVPSVSVERGSSFDITIKLQNTGAGHHVPTGHPNKKLTITVDLLDTAGKALAPTHTESLGRTVEDVAPYNTTADTRIPAGGEYEFPVSLTISHKKPAGPIQLVVRASTGREPATLISVPLELR